MENFAAGLPRLRDPELGYPRHFNSCNITVASLLLIYSRCLDIVALEVHFNTRTIVSDIQRLVDAGVGHDEAKCGLPSLTGGALPFGVRGEVIEAVAMGLKIILPRRMNILHYDSGWCTLVPPALWRLSIGA